MEPFYLLCFIVVMQVNETMGHLSQNKTLQESDTRMFPSIVSNKVSNVLRDILKQETLNRFSMVQKMQSMETKLNQLNESLQVISANNDRLASTRDMLKILSTALNKTFETALEDLSESSLQWSQISKKLTNYTGNYSDCWDILRKYPSLQGVDGVYPLTIASKTKFVYCDMTTEGGGWTAIQRRQDGSTDFYRTWSEYKQGFGDPSTNYWIGNDAIYEMTKNKDQELRVELQRFNGDKAYAQYSTFYIGDEDSKFTLIVSGYSGTAGDSLADHNGMKFSTKNRDNDRYFSGSCATSYHGAWWYNNCAYANLNGEYVNSAGTSNDYPTWYKWKNKWEALKQTVMMIRHS